MKILMVVALGGAVGASARYLVASQLGLWVGSGFPWPTLAVNIIGSFALGVFIELSALVWSPTTELRAFVVVGVLGGFTTFSAFSMDLILLAERGRIESAAIYAAASVGFAIAGLFAGLRLIRWIVA